MNLKKKETDCSCAFKPFCNLKVFQSSFLLSVTFDILLGRLIEICLTRSCIFAIYKQFLKLHKDVCTSFIAILLINTFKGVRVFSSHLLLA